MKPIYTGLDLANGEDWTSEALIKNREIVSVRILRKNYGESPLAKCVPDLIKMKQLKAFYKEKDKL